MRNFTLVGLLVTVCIILILFAKVEIPIAQKGHQLQPIAQQIAGRDENNEPVGHSISFTPDLQGNQLKGLKVATLEPGGAMEKHFGLQVGDEIVQIGELTMDTFNGDDQLAAADVSEEGYQKGKPLTVLRNGQTMILPVGANPDGSSDLMKQLNHLNVQP
jgi:hypothetical protein